MKPTQNEEVLLIMTCYNHTQYLDIDDMIFGEGRKIESER